VGLALFSLGGDIAGFSFPCSAASHSSLRPPAFDCSFSLGSADEWFALSGLFALLCPSVSEAGLLLLVVVVVAALIGLSGLSLLALFCGEGVRGGVLRLVEKDGRRVSSRLLGEDGGRVSSRLVDLPCPVASHSCLRFVGFGSVFLSVQNFSPSQYV
jgi:hypothetical protein